MGVVSPVCYLEKVLNYVCLQFMTCTHLTPCTDNTLQLVHQQPREGSVYQVVPFNGMLIASVHNDVQVLSWSEENSALEDVCNYSNTILALYVKAKGDFILVSTKWTLVSLSYTFVMYLMSACTYSLISTLRHACTGVQTHIVCISVH